MTLAVCRYSGGIARCRKEPRPCPGMSSVRQHLGYDSYDIKLGPPSHRYGRLCCFPAVTAQLSDAVGLGVVLFNWGFIFTSTGLSVQALRFEYRHANNAFLAASFTVTTQLHMYSNCGSAAGLFPVCFALFGCLRDDSGYLLL